MAGRQGEAYPRNTCRGTAIGPEAFLSSPGVIFDVRSPVEFRSGHIPGAVNLPLFSDQEREAVGTVYKQQGKKEAVALGMRIALPKAAALVEEVAAYSSFPAKIHCWRGGMRSRAVAALLLSHEIPTVVLHGGYKAFKKWGRALFAAPFRYLVLGGLTGCGKTAILAHMKNLGEQVLDLETLARHRGSVFGHLGMPPQPTTEQFHNEIAYALAHFDPLRPVWIEDEDRRIGTCHLPEPLYAAKKKAPHFLIEKPLHERTEQLRKDYGTASIESLIAASERLRKKLGNVKANEVIALLKDGKFEYAGAIVIGYYDASYRKTLKNNEGRTHLNHPGKDTASWAQTLILQARGFAGSVPG